MKSKSITLEEAVQTANTGLDAIRRAPIVNEETGIKCLRIQDVSQKKSYVNWGNTTVLDKDFEKFQLKTNDLIVARTGGSIGVNLIIKNTLNAVFNNGLIRLRAKEEFNPVFLYYLMQTREFINHINSIAHSTSTQPNMKIRDLLKFEFKNYDLDKQSKIVKILSSIDSKININNKINKSLGDLTRLIFKSWFIDFDPVRAKMFARKKGLNIEESERAAIATLSGVCGPSEYSDNFDEMSKQLNLKLKKMSEDEIKNLKSTSSLFPYELEDSEFGEIPKGFSLNILADVAEVIGGGTPSTKVKEYYCDKGTGISWLSPKDLSGYTWKYIPNGCTDITELGLRKSSARLMPEGTVVVSSRAPIGYIAIAEKELTTNQGFKSLVPKEKVGTEFLYNWAISNIQAMESVATGSTFKEISGANMKNLKIVVPSTQLSERFEEVVKHNSEFQKKIRKETEYLETLRDILLPKLLSGEVDLSEVELGDDK